MVKSDGVRKVAPSVHVVCLILPVVFAKERFNAVVVVIAAVESAVNSCACPARPSVCAASLQTCRFVAFMDPLSALGTGHFSQLLASALDVGDKPATEEAAKGSHSPSSGHLANDVDVVSKQQSSVERMKTAVHSHLSSQLTSDFIEGLRPVINSGKLHIATYIPLQGEEEPAFIGNYPSIQAAVQAQRQTHALVSTGRDLQ